jgi:hypothetical protein
MEKSEMLSVTAWRLRTVNAMMWTVGSTQQAQWSTSIARHAFAPTAFWIATVELVLKNAKTMSGSAKATRRVSQCLIYAMETTTVVTGQTKKKLTARSLADLENISAYLTENALTMFFDVTERCNVRTRATN